MDDCLSLSDNESEFSGFEEVETPQIGATMEVSTENTSPKKLKSVVTKKSTNTKNGSQSKKGKTISSKGNKPKAKPKASGSKVKSLEIDSLSSKDIETLRSKLGLDMNNNQSDDDWVPVDRNPHSRPNLIIEVDRDDMSDQERPTISNVTKDLQRELFGESDVSGAEEECWGLPKAKQLERSKPVSKSLANLINTACTSACDTAETVSKYKVPENVMAVPPLVNQEIWKVLDKQARYVDRSASDIQTLLATAMVPVMKFAQILKPQIQANEEAKALVTDTLTLMGQVQYNLSLKRRYAIRPNLKKKYSNICHVSTPITSKLFGDDVAKEIKACDSTSFLGKDQYTSHYKPSSYRGRGGNSYKSNYRRGQQQGYNAYGNYGYQNFQGQRYQPYSRGQARGSYNPYKSKAARKPTATSTSEGN